MSKCKCNAKPRIVSDMVRAVCNDGCCKDVCANPIYEEPDKLSLMAPLIYDEIGINLCATFPIGTDISTTYPSVTNACIEIVNITYAAESVDITPIPGRPNCTRINLSDLTVVVFLKLYDASCRQVAVLVLEPVYLPSDETAPTYDADTNPSSAELDVYTPYGISYITGTTTPIINYIGFSSGANMMTQGLNMYSRGKLLDFNIAGDTITVGLTLVIQSLYFAGYKVKSEGKIDTPKGSIITPENSDCMRFVAGDLLDLAIRPLDLGGYKKEEHCKKDCQPNTCTCCN